jgi:hypothetical protein
MVYVNVLLVTSSKSGLSRHEAHVGKIRSSCTVVVGVLMIRPDHGDIEINFRAV